MEVWKILELIFNHILQLLFNISSQIILKIGDGSTSSIVAADSIFNNLSKCEELKTIRSKDLMDVVKHCVELITGIILINSTKIDPIKDPEFSDIYKLAIISTNGNKEVSEMIRFIYADTGNSSIEFNKSRTGKTNFEIVNGYKCMINYMDPIFITNDAGTCDITKPMMLMFNHKIEMIHYEKIIQPLIQEALNSDRRIVVIAPYYDNQLLNLIRRNSNIEFRATQKCTVVYTKVALISDMHNEYFNDFCMMTGAMMINESAAEDIIEGKINLEEYVGEVGKISIGDKTSLIKDCFKMNTDEHQRYMNDAVSKYKRVEETHSQLGVVNSELYDLKQRISKLRGKMGIISVGGYSTLEKDSNFDLVEDAVKSCESAYNYGFNIGGNLAIPITIQKLLCNDFGIPELDKIVLRLFDTAFKEVFFKVLKNKYTHESDVYINSLVNEAIDRRQCWDLINEKFSDDVINSCHTDIEILKASTSIISLLISSNQYISIPQPTE